MEAIDFKTIITSNGIIEIPEPYKDFSQGLVKVIILKEKEISYKDELARRYAKLQAVIEEIQD